MNGPQPHRGEDRKPGKDRLSIIDAAERSFRKNVKGKGQMSLFLKVYLTVLVWLVIFDNTPHCRHLQGNTPQEPGWQ